MAEAAAADKGGRTSAKEQAVADVSLALKDGVGNGSAEAGKDAESREELLALQAALDSAKKGKMPDDVLQKMQKAVDDQRAKHRAAKPAVAQAKNLERSIEELGAKADRHKKKAEEVRAEIAALQATLEEHTQAESLANTKLEEARAEAERIRAKVVEQAKAELEENDADGLQLACFPENPVDAAWLAQQKPEVIERFKRYRARNSGKGSGSAKPGGKTAQTAAAAGAALAESTPLPKNAFDLDDLMADDLADALFGDDEGDRDAFRDLMAKRDRSMVEQAFDKVSAAKRKKCG